MYSYSDENRFEHPNTYMYTPFGGTEFLTAYFSNRATAITTLQERESDESLSAAVVPDCLTHRELQEIQEQLQQGEQGDALAKLEHYIRRFEVAKRLRNEYPVTDLSDRAPIQTHILFYNLLIVAYARHNDIRYINVMLKVSDTLISVLGSVSSADSIGLLSSLFEQEMEIVEALMEKLEVSK